MSKTTWIKYNGVSLNATMLGAKSKEDFIAHEKHNFPETPEGSKQLEEAYSHIQAKVNPPVKVEAPTEEAAQGKGKKTQP